MQVLVASSELSLTDMVVREAVEIVSSIAYMSLVYEGELRILFVRPWGKMGPGIWIRRVSDGPTISPPWPHCQSCGCALTTSIGGLEEHEPGCPNFPL